jgi:tetratricopeptide (TPR) repeat protein
MFLHGGFWHLFGNMIFLWLSGTSLEDVWGRKYYLAIFIAGGVVAAISHHIVNAGSYIPSIGASGAVAALMGAYTIRFATTRLRFVFFQWNFWVPAWILLPLWFSREVYYAIKFWGEFTGVATWAHIGGYLFGVAAALVLTKIGAEETFIAKSLSAQDKKDREKARIKQEKKAGPRPRSKEVEKGIEARQLGEHQDAKQWFYLALEADPEDLEAREELIRLHTQLAELPETARQMGAMVSYFLEKGDRETALGWYNEIVRQNLYSHSIGAWTFDIAQELAKMGAWEAAAVNYANFARVCGRDPRASKALFSAGNIYIDRLNKFPEAVEVFNQILTCFPAWMPDEVKACRDRAQRMVAAG